jgi:hypothetical protein
MRQGNRSDRVSPLGKGEGRVNFGSNHNSPQKGFPKEIDQDKFLDGIDEFLQDVTLSAYLKH